MDLPVARLLKDRKQRRLLRETLVVWCTEFGRTPFTQGVDKPGRDHHQHVFTCRMAGGGLRPGIAHGESDEVGYVHRRGPVSIHDFHATMLHLLGLDHQRLVFYHNGIARRLTDVHGEVVPDVSGRAVNAGQRQNILAPLFIAYLGSGSVSGPASGSRCAASVSRSTLCHPNTSRHTPSPSRASAPTRSASGLAARLASSATKSG